MDHSPTCSRVHGFSQARILEWVTIFFSRGSSLHRGLTHVSCIVGRSLLLSRQWEKKNTHTHTHTHTHEKIEENNRKGKTRDLFKKIRDTKGTFHAEMGSIKERDSMDLTEAEDFKKRWSEYTELYKKDLHDPDNHDGVITHLEPDILECKVK